MGENAWHRQTDSVRSNARFRGRTTVRFLGQQSEVNIDGTWPQMGEMRSLWNGTTEFGKEDMPKDGTWEPNRHYSEIRQLFRNHLNRTAGAMHPPFVSTVAQTEHVRRDSFLSVMSHAEDAKGKGRHVVLASSGIIPRVQHPPRRPLLCHSTSRCCF